MGPQDDRVYEFGPFRLDMEDRLLSRDETTVPLEPTQFDVLAALVRHAGHLVTREHLIHEVWKDTYVDEGSLTVTISILRRKLGDSPSQSRYIETVRKSGYRFAAPVTRASVSERRSLPPASQPLGGMRRDLTLAAMAVGLVAAAAVVWYSSRSTVRDQATSPVLLHPFGGVQDDPSFSPDGHHVAFSWRPPQSDNHDIYVLRIGDHDATRLTSDPALDKSPVWSPNGRQIAFIRRRGSTGEIRLISPAGGPERTLVETLGTLVTWSANSETLAFIDRAADDDAHSIFVVPAAGGAKRQITLPAAERTYGDSSPAFSPDGRMLAFVRHRTFDVADIFVQPFDGGEPRQVTFDKRQIRGLAWLPGSRELIFSSNRSGRHHLWRVKVNGRTQPTLVDGTAEGRSPAVSAGQAGSGFRLVYQAFTEDYNVRILTRGAGGEWDASKLSYFAASVRDEHTPRLSPDGRRIAFVSDRSGWFEVWVCEYPQAGGCRQLTAFQQGYVGSPSWSPDSQRIAFDARVDGNADIYVVRADGGQPVRLTHDSSIESAPSWSHDDRWIYFRSDRTGTHQIWKMPVSGGAPIQVTSGGGYEALEAIDGKSLYYVRARYFGGLWKMPVDGGPETRVSGAGSLRGGAWTIVDRGILWIDVATGNPPATIRFYDAATGEVSKVAEVANFVIPSATGFAAARDGTVLLWSQLDRSAYDLMLLDRFR